MHIDTDCINPSEQSILNRPSVDKFLLVLNFPEVLRDKIYEGRKIDVEPIQVSVYGSIVPQIVVPSVEVPFGGQTYNITSYTRTNHDPLTINYVVDNKFYNYWVLWRWLFVLNDARKSIYNGSDELLGSNKINEYQAHVSVFGLDEYNNKIVEFIYYYCFITRLAGINYNYRESNIIESSFELQFSQFDVKVQPSS